MYKLEFTIGIKKVSGDFFERLLRGKTFTVKQIVWTKWGR